VLSAVLEQPLDVETSEALSEGDRLLRAAVELVQTVVGAEPERAPRLENGAHRNRVTGRQREVAEDVVVAIVTAEAHRRTDPQDMLAILVDREDLVVGEAGRVVGAMPIHGEGVSVVAIHSLLRAEPDEAVAVLHQRRHQ
jgi:hypothetical protein